MSLKRAQFAEIVALRKRGLSYNEIARRVGCSYGAVGHFIRRAHPELCDVGVPTGVPKGTRPMRAKENIETIVALKATGATLREIADKIGVSPQGVALALKARAPLSPQV